jgi:hypothetical protein
VGQRYILGEKKQQKEHFVGSGYSVTRLSYGCIIPGRQFVNVKKKKHTNY